jgi:hypothetical protein
MRALSRLSYHGLMAVLSVVLLFSSSFACWSQLSQPMSPEECCAKGGCKRTPGQPAHSSCRIIPVSTDRLVPPVSSAAPVLQMIHVLVDVENDLRVSRFVPAGRSANLSPHPLFLANSSFRI